MSKCKECGQEIPKITSVWTELKVRVDLSTGEIKDWLGIVDESGSPVPLLRWSLSSSIYLRSMQKEEGSTNATNI